MRADILRIVHVLRLLVSHTKFRSHEKSAVVDAMNMDRVITYRHAFLYGLIEPQKGLRRRYCVGARAIEHYLLPRSTNEAQR